MICLGVNSVYHESAAALVVDGVLVAAAEEERFCRVKHAKAAEVGNPHLLPAQAIEYCLKAAGVEAATVDLVGYSFDPRRRRNGWREKVVAGDWGSPEGEETFLGKLKLVPERLESLGLTADFRWLDHHLCHAASAFFASPFEECAVLTLDGIGENDSSAMALGSGTDLEVIERLGYPHSLGFVWEKMAAFLGFSAYDAGKVMGLAPYGDPARFAEVFKRLIWIAEAGRFAVDPELLCFRSPEFAPLEELFGVGRRSPHDPLLEVHQDVAAGLQAATDMVVLHRVRELHRRSGRSRLALAGGVALNCISNRVAFEEGPFDELFIQPAAHDAGTAVGAALYLAASMAGRRPQPAPDPYLGPAFSEQQLEDFLGDLGARFSRPPELTSVVSERLAAGQLVGWFQGRMELGPRALGNRSLLADPRDPEMRRKLNTRIKHRESFRPFAPSVLSERLEEWFEVKKPTSAAESMMLCYPMKAERRELVPAVVHVDGSSRVQAVSAALNPTFHGLLSNFEQRTGVPMLLNTSFNDREPIVCTPEDAYRSFSRMGLDALAIGPFLVEGP